MKLLLKCFNEKERIIKMKSIKSDEKLILFQNKLDWDAAMIQLGAAGYKWPTGLLAAKLASIYSDGIFILVNDNNKSIAVYANYFDIPRFAAEDLKDEAIDGEVYLEQLIGIRKFLAA